MSDRYMRLVEAWQREVGSEELQGIPDGFLGEMREYLSQLNQTPAGVDHLRASLIKTEREFANQMFQELLETRLRKIVYSELDGAPIDAQAMTPEEQRLHSTLRGLLSEYRRGPGEAPRRTPPPSPPAVEPQPQVEPQTEEPEMVVVRFLQPLPAIMGVDMKAYGPFQPEDVASLPKKNAENLVKRGVAVLVEAGP